MLKTITPIDNSILVERNFANDNEIETVLQNAKEARNMWKDTSLNERKEIVSNFVNYFLLNDKDIVENANRLKPAFLVFNNYELILKWNRSLRFALAVCTLKNNFSNEL